MPILGAVFALAQVGATASTPTRPDVRPPSESAANACLAVTVSSPEAPKKRGPYSATQILDLQFGARLRRRLAGEHVINLKVYTPRGHLYQQVDVPFSGAAAPFAAGGAEASASPRMRRVDGYPQPLPEQQLVAVKTSVGRAYQVTARLPVAGTSIMTSSLYGKWKVVPHLDGSLKPCGAATVFSITQ
jgi:hypothetical protein